ncbi:MAG: branched-chain amino acid ABC transporter permease [bacterium]
MIINTVKKRFTEIRKRPIVWSCGIIAFIGLTIFLTQVGMPLSYSLLIFAIFLVSVLFSKSKLLPVLLTIILSIMPWTSKDQYWLRVMITVGIYIMLALGLNIIIGFTGMLDLGYIAFYGIGAYTTAILTTQFHISFWFCLIASIAIASLFGVLRGLPTLRLSGDYLAIVTLGFGEIIRMTFTNWVSLTGGPMGIRDITPPAILGLSFGFSAHWGYRLYFYLILFLLGITVMTIYNLRNSRLGRALLAIREDETAAQMMGINLAWNKTLAYAVGSAYGGLAGAFFASFNMFVSPNSFTFFESAIVLCMVVIGGLGSIPGVIIGASILASFPEALRFLSEYRYLIFGLLMVVMIIFRPKGILPER